ncbi:MAG: LPS biosynthesis protein [Legionellales bacterium]|nr:LPS biosynthesis protein [Legionellales bacterium]OUX67511.1 MAG: hypothetical protein CBD38_02405 [bacterium TMED178]|tara:strand:- start:2001 stop:2756 length:756 start_codon:yes stop_codon:yes gene_type:complete
MNNHSKISAVIITYNEADRIRKCLDSIRWVDEIIIVDSFSTDDTVKICQEYTSSIFTKKFEGFGTQKQYACAQASHPWILTIDADEMLSEPLIKKIKKIIQINDKQYNGYFIHRKIKFLGKVLNFTFGKEYVLRLFRKAHGDFNSLKLHEYVELEGHVGYLSEYMVHESFRDINHIIDKTNSYTSMHAENHPIKRCVISQAVIHSIFTFIRHYIFYAGILDGRQGFIMSASMAQGCFYKYLKGFYQHHPSK